MNFARVALVAILALGCLTAPLVAEGQQAGKVPRIGILAGQSSSCVLPVLDRFRQELRKLGWLEGRPSPCSSCARRRVATSASPRSRRRS
jgi:hypothetical protein